ncbi:tyrosine-protein kinase YwqD [mine drainage metagenome]|uniref:Tyrosine-protein kinase YwqD n=1 Tax=mine drainage metagenome TaxID=410659 RepID=A0A1J5PZD7_9ZZZZ
MDRLQIAIEKARAKRGSRNSAAQIGPEHAAAGGDPWLSLTPIEIKRPMLERNRIIALSGGPDVAPYDHLRTRILQQARQHDWRRIALVSPHSACGKSTTAVNLAFSFGRQSDVRTLVLDLDLRRPRLAGILAQQSEFSMPDVLERRVPFSSLGMRYGDNLAFGFTMERVPNSAELLQSQQTSDVLSEIEAAYKPDICLYDMPPMMASDDTFGFLKNVDCVLMLAEAEKTPVAQIDIAERQLAELTNVMGIVLNKCNYADGLYGYDYGYE